MNWIELVDSYLAQQRQLGYLLVSEGRYLQSFARFAQSQHLEALTVELALNWANLAPSGSNIAIARRFCTLRPFSRYLSARGHGSVVLPSHFIGPTHRRLPPFIFTNSDIVRLMNAAVKLIPLDGLRPITIKTLIGLLASSGLRPGEAVRLRCQDVSLNDGTLTIQNSKGWKQRMIPISLSTVAALKAYDMQRNQLNPFSQTGAFFEFDNDQPLNIRSADHAFKVIREATGLVTDLNGRLPRLYDLRHTFVCRRVIEWYETDENVDSRVAQLSCYLGHKKVSDTYWYLTAIPALMAHAADKSNGYGNFGGVS
jgi:integrase/recombinase XerD